MLPKHPDFEEKICFRYLEEHEGSFAYCDGPSKRTDYFITPALLFIYFLKLHERFHQWTYALWEWTEDCDDPSCVMAEDKSLSTLIDKIKRRKDAGEWYCEKCLKLMEQFNVEDN